MKRLREPMDMSETISPKSDQQNYDDYIAGPRTVTISAVTKGSPEQPVNVELVEYPGRPFKPNKSMRRILVSAWGTDSSAYVGRRMTLFGNAEVIYGGKAVGGVEIAALSHLSKPLTVALTATRGKRKSFTVQPLAEPVKQDWLGIATQAEGDADTLRAIWTDARNAGETTDILDQIRALATPAANEAPAS